MGLINDSSVPRINPRGKSASAIDHEKFPYPHHTASLTAPGQA